MLDLQITYANSVVRALADIGVKPPKAVADAVAVRGAALDFEPQPFDPETLHTAKPGEVLDLLDAASTAAARAAAMKALHGEIHAVTARRLVGAVNGHTDEILASVGDRFDKLADEFSRLVAKLPRGFDDPAVLVAAGPAAVQAFSEAQSAAAELEPLLDLRRNLPGADIVTRFGKATQFAEVADQQTAANVAAVTAGPLGLLAAILQVPGTRLRWWRSRFEQQAHINGLAEVEREVTIFTSMS